MYQLAHKVTVSALSINTYMYATKKKLPTQAREITCTPRVDQTTTINSEVKGKMPLKTDNTGLPFTWPLRHKSYNK